jgi:hypothetical protein
MIARINQNFEGYTLLDLKVGIKSRDKKYFETKIC